jgi:GH15 family glucan-1,4-alpha-glucosidase
MSSPSRDRRGASDAGTSSYEPISEYGLLSDCHSVALVSRRGSIDWYCVPRIDSQAVFGRLLDADLGGSCSIGPDREADRQADDWTIERRYLDRTMVLETVHRSEEGELRVRDCLAMRVAGPLDPPQQLIRVAECTSGSVDVAIDISPRFDFGTIPPWVRQHPNGSITAVGGSGGLALWSNLEFERVDRYDVGARGRLRAGERAVLSISTYEPQALDAGPPEDVDVDELLERLEETERWWTGWCDNREGGHDGLDSESLRSALMLKSLMYAPTGAIAAAATTSLPEIPGGGWNWDYRFSWVRDSWMTVKSLAEAGFEQESESFHRFIERSSAGAGTELRVMYGVDGRHRMPEVELGELSGYQGARPVRIGNAAQVQLQLDMYGYLLELTWYRVCQGADIEDAFWQFVTELVDIVCRRWREPDHGIWELRGEPQHYTYSKVQCWVALDRGLALAKELDRLDEVDADRWRTSRDEVRDAINANGVRDGRFVSTFDGSDADASLLLIPEFRYIDGDDAIMSSTVDAVIEQLDEGGLIRRFSPSDPSSTEGAFVACTFWLVERLVDLGRHGEAREYFARAMATSNDLGLFAEEYDVETDEMLGNVPQALSHLSHLAAVHALGKLHR